MDNDHETGNKVEVMKRLKEKILHRVHLWKYKPIRVFVFHAVSDEFNPMYGWKGDWTQLDTFKRKILGYKRKYTFISLSEALTHLKTDTFRLHKYAVLTSDDGLKSLENVLPWLKEERIPITLFLSAKYFDGESYYKGYDPYWEKQGKPIPAVRANELYLSKKQVWDLKNPFVEIAIHGWEHATIQDMPLEEFEQQTKKAEEVLSNHPRYVPFYAYTYGKYTKSSVEYLKNKQLVPVLCDGQINVKFDGFIHRECIDGE